MRAGREDGDADRGADVGGADDGVDALAETLAGFDTLSGLINCSGINPTPDTVAEIDRSEWQLTLDLNLTSVWRTASLALPKLRAARSGGVVLVSSVFGIRTPSRRAAYGVSKHALTGLAQAIAQEEEGIVRQEGDRWGVGALDDAPVPVLLPQIVDARLARLGDADDALLAVAAVIGQEVPLALWAAVANTDEEGLLDTVDRAVEARLLAESHDVGTVRFAHALVREALYQGTLPMRRRALHRRTAEAMMVTPSPDPDAVAYHLHQAGDVRAARRPDLWKRRSGRSPVCDRWRAPTIRGPRWGSTSLAGAILTD